MDRLKRIRIFFRTRFPLHSMGLGAVLMFFSFYAMAVATGSGTFRVDETLLFGLVTFFLSLLLLRLMDELKDEDIEPEIFPNRPLVTGQVRYSDVRLLLLLSTLALLVLNIDRGIATQAFFVFFVFAVLAWQWWLFPDVMDRHYGLVALTHQPLIPLLYAYVYAVYLYRQGAPFDVSQLLLLMVIFWPLILAWEVARKVRSPEEEDAYLTYTRRWGTRRAAIVPIASIWASTVGMVAACYGFGLPSALIGYHALIALGASVIVGRFVLKPAKRTNQVKASVEAHSALFYGGTAAFLLFGWGAS